MDQQDFLLDKCLSAGHIFCLNEINMEAKSTNIVFVVCSFKNNYYVAWILVAITNIQWTYLYSQAINPSTGECTYEQFSDNTSREELQKRLQMINPAEILCPSTLSVDTERLLNHR